MKTKKEVQDYLQEKFSSPGSMGKPENLIDVLVKFQNDPDIKMTTVKDVNEMCDKFFFTVNENGNPIVVYHIDARWIIDKSQSYFNKNNLGSKS